MLKTISSLQGVSILSRDAQKKISGGLAEAEAGAGGGYYCFAQVNGQVNLYYSASSLSQAANQAQGAATGHWCCNSCPSATWLQGVVEFR
jgi:hypothetical protein